MVTDEECREVLEQQELAVDAMSRLLNALLDISKLESGAIKLELTDFELGPLFEEMRREFAGMAASKGLRFSIDSPVELVHSDPALVGQVLRNLLSNAIKYTRAASVELRCEKRGTRGCASKCATVASASPPTRCAQIFEEFYQVGVSPNSSRDGYGLGLSIVQRIARLLDIQGRGEIGAGQGLGVFVRIADRAARGRAVAATGSRVARRQCRRRRHIHMLLVEDEPGVRNAMRMLLKIEGYRRGDRGRARPKRSSCCATARLRPASSRIITSRTDARARR